MLPSFIRSFLWGSEEHCFPVTNEEHFVTEQQDDWLLISEQDTIEKTCETLSECSENSQGWVVTPPSCGQGEGEARYNSLDDLLIEHPSMSVYFTNTIQDPPHEEENRVALRPLPQGVQPAHPVVRTPTDYAQTNTNKIPKVTKKSTKRHNQQRNNSGKQSKALRKCQALRQGCFNAGRRHC